MATNDEIYEELVKGWASTKNMSVELVMQLQVQLKQWRERYGK